MTLLLTRDAFREAVFARDKHGCVFCGAPAQDAHHVVERRLWPDGGYYVDNGASVCSEHHVACEQTTLSVEEVRAAAGIKKILVPPHFYADQPIDKWGNPVLQSRKRLRGELFFDESVQKVLRAGGVLDLFTHHVKYPRTHHLPWSQNVHSDDRLVDSMREFEGQRVVLTTKMDGENTTLYRDYTHARSLDSAHHSSRDWVKNFWGSIAPEIPEQWRVCGENLYATHSIHYESLPSYFLGFSVWDEKNVCLSWDETLEWFQLLGVTPVETVYDGAYDEKALREICESSTWEDTEGFVLRVARPFSYAEFRHCAAKFVRRDHVQTVKHWMRGQAVVPNSLEKTERPSE